jgi:hypothetical protein
MLVLGTYELREYCQCAAIQYTVTVHPIQGEPHYYVVVRSSSGSLRAPAFLLDFKIDYRAFGSVQVS